jgi:uroporphyrinogen-III synthase
LDWAQSHFAYKYLMIIRPKAARKQSGDALMSELSLAGRVIAAPETRELDIFVGLLERRGATVLRCPMVAIHDAPDPAPVLAWIERVMTGSCDDLILLTGEGLRRILGCIDRHVPARRDAFIDRLTSIRKITRGPKPARVLRDLGLQSDLSAKTPTTDGVIAALSQHDLHNRVVAVQLYGSEPNIKLIEFLKQAGATPLPVAPYVYADKSEDQALLSLTQQLLQGHVDALAFTSMQQVTRFIDVVGDEQAKAALANTLVAAVGPVVAESLKQRGIKVDLMPEDAYFLKPLTRALEERLGPKN